MAGARAEVAGMGVAVTPKPPDTENGENESAMDTGTSTEQAGIDTSLALRGAHRYVYILHLMFCNRVSSSSASLPIEVLSVMIAMYTVRGNA